MHPHCKGCSCHQNRWQHDYMELCTVKPCKLSMATAFWLAEYCITVVIWPCCIENMWQPCGPLHTDSRGPHSQEQHPPALSVPAWTAECPQPQRFPPSTLDALYQGWETHPCPTHITMIDQEQIATSTILMVVIVTRAYSGYICTIVCL